VVLTKGSITSTGDKKEKGRRKVVVAGQAKDDPLVAYTRALTT